MRWFVVFFLFFGYAMPRVQAQDTEDKFVAFPAVGLEIAKPLGFANATSFHGFQQDDTSSSVVLVSIPGPFLEVTKGFTQEVMAKQGIRLSSKESVEISGHSGLLLNVSQEAYDTMFQKWIAAFGDDEMTFLVTATFPDALSDQLSANLRQVALSANVIEPSQESLPVEITPASGLREAKLGGSLGKIAMFSKDGKIPATSPDDPIFIVAPSMGAPETGDRHEFAKRRLAAATEYHRRGH